MHEEVSVVGSWGFSWAYEQFHETTQHQHRISIRTRSLCHTFLRLLSNIILHWVWPG